MLIYYIRKFFYVYGYYLFIGVFSYQCAYFNTFYNAEKSFSKAVKVIQNAPILEDNKLPSESSSLLNEVINNCDIIIDKYPKSKYIDKAYLLKGMSYFYKKSYDLSIQNLQILLDDDNSNYHDQATLWSTYSFLRTKNIDQTNYYMNSIRVDELNDEDLYIYYNIKSSIFMSS